MNREEQSQKKKKKIPLLLVLFEVVVCYLMALHTEQSMLVAFVFWFKKTSR